MKIDYDKIKWDASTYWEFCGTKGNLRIVWDRYKEHFSVQVPIEEFAYGAPHMGLAFARGDIVTYNVPKSAPRYATVTNPASSNGYLYICFANGEDLAVHPSSVSDCLAIADIPDELIALARAEAGKPLDFSKCPLKKPACTGAERWS